MTVLVNVYVCSYHFEVQHLYNEEIKRDQVIYTHVMSRGKTKERHYGWWKKNDAVIIILDFAKVFFLSVFFSVILSVFLSLSISLTVVREIDKDCSDSFCTKSKYVLCFNQISLYSTIKKLSTVICMHHLLHG